MTSHRNRLPFALLIVLGLVLTATQLSVVGSHHEAQAAGSYDARLAKAYRFDRSGWIYVHLEGTRHTAGYQHGYLLAPQIDDGERPSIGG